MVCRLVQSYCKSFSVEVMFVIKCINGCIIRNRHFAYMSKWLMSCPDSRPGVVYDMEIQRMQVTAASTLIERTKCMYTNCAEHVKLFLLSIISMLQSRSLKQSSHERMVAVRMLVYYMSCPSPTGFPITVAMVTDSWSHSQNANVFLMPDLLIPSAILPAYPSMMNAFLFPFH